MYGVSLTLNASVFLSFYNLKKEILGPHSCLGCCTQAFSGWGKQVVMHQHVASCHAPASHSSGSFCRGAQALDSQASTVAAHRHRSCGAQV